MEHVIRLREETGESMMTCKILLDDHNYNNAKQMILDIQKEIKDRGGAADWSRGELGSLPFWTRQIINSKRPRLAAGESNE